MQSGMGTAVPRGGSGAGVDAPSVGSAELPPPCLPPLVPCFCHLLRYRRVVAEACGFRLQGPIATADLRNPWKRIPPTGHTFPFRSIGPAEIITEMVWFDLEIDGMLVLFLDYIAHEFEDLFSSSEIPRPVFAISTPVKASEARRVSGQTVPEEESNSFIPDAHRLSDFNCCAKPNISIRAYIARFFPCFNGTSLSSLLSRLWLLQSSGSAWVLAQVLIRKLIHKRALVGDHRPVLTNLVWRLFLLVGWCCHLAVEFHW